MDRAEVNAPARLSYPTKAKVEAAVAAFKAAREHCVDVAAIEVKPDGTIRVLGPEAFPAAPRDEFEHWDQAGKLG